MVLEEEEEDAQPITRKSEIRILDTRGAETRTVSYNDLDREEKENVLTDLLVKSAINHALEKQKKVRNSFKKYFSQISICDNVFENNSQQRCFYCCSKFAGKLVLNSGRPK